MGLCVCGGEGALSEKAETYFGEDVGDVHLYLNQWRPWQLSRTHSFLKLPTNTARIHAWTKNKRSALFFKNFTFIHTLKQHLRSPEKRTPHCVMICVKMGLEKWNRWRWVTWEWAAINFTGCNLAEQAHEWLLSNKRFIIRHLRFSMSAKLTASLLLTLDPNSGLSVDLGMFADHMRQCANTHRFSE